MIARPQWANVCWLAWASGGIAAFTLPWLDYLSELGTKNEDHVFVWVANASHFVSRLTWPRTRLHTGSYFSLKLAKRYS